MHPGARLDSDVAAEPGLVVDADGVGGVVPTREPDLMVADRRGRAARDDGVGEAPLPIGNGPSFSQRFRLNGCVSK